MLKSLMLTPALLPSLTFAQPQQLPQPCRSGQWCSEGWSNRRKPARSAEQLSQDGRMTRNIEGLDD